MKDEKRKRTARERKHAGSAGAPPASGKRRPAAAKQRPASAGQRSPVRKQKKVIRRGIPAPPPSRHNINTYGFAGADDYVAARQAQAAVTPTARERLFRPLRLIRITKAPTLMWLVTLYELLCLVCLIGAGAALEAKLFLSYGLLIAVQWLYLLIADKCFKRDFFELEIIAFFLCATGITLIASVAPSGLFTQSLSLIMGVVFFSLLVWFLRDVDRVMKFRYAIGAAAIVLFAVNLLFGVVSHGSKNWIEVGGFSLQPSELIKVAFIFVGASTLQKLQTTTNLTAFIAFAMVCIGALFLMGDFGTACIFFFAFLIIAFMRSGDIRTIILIVAAALIGAFMILQFKPYIADRFAVWRHVWDYAYDTGYQQTRVLIYAASGGLFGTGIGHGELKNVFASSTDLVFGVICEEWGFLFAIAVVAVFAAMVWHTRYLSKTSTCAFYTIASVAAASMLLFQVCLNVFGITDIVPLTGVTLPFISRGGSSMIASWGLLAFIKAADPRTYVRQKKKVSEQ